MSTFRITAGQCRAARAFIGISVDSLAAVSGVSARTIASFEGGKSVRDANVAAIRKSLEAKGAVFTPRGVEVREPVEA